MLDGRDVALLRIAVVDANGVPTSAGAPQGGINVSVEVVSGPGRLVGVGNGDLSTHQRPQGNVIQTDPDKSPNWKRYTDMTRVGLGCIEVAFRLYGARCCTFSLWHGPGLVLFSTSVQKCGCCENASTYKCSTKKVWSLRRRFTV